jgi:hypothetical protein
VDGTPSDGSAHRVVRAMLDPEAVLIVGIPSIESQVHASPGSKAGRINCKSAPDLKTLVEKFFRSVLMFSMNDEIVHTGYHKIARYIFAVASHPKQIPG